MRSQRLKDIYYATLGAISLVNYQKLKIRNPYLKESRLVLHLGSGHHNLKLPGFLNIDGNWFRKPDVWLDVTRGLPFPDNSVSAIFSNHFFEHLREEELSTLFKESLRILRPGGVMRIVTPDLRKSIDAYLKRDPSFFSDFPEKRKSIGGRFNNHLLCQDQHRLMFDFDFLEEILKAAGFTTCKEVTPRKSSLFSKDELKAMSSEPEKNFSSLFVEAEKSARAAKKAA